MDDVILYRQDESEFHAGLTRLEELWREFATSSVIPKGSVRPSIVNSWVRCQNMNMQPKVSQPALLGHDRLARRLRANRENIEIIIRVVDKVEEFAKASGYLISFLDNEGYILTLQGNPKLEEIVGRVHFKLGANWSEQFMGTTAVGVTLATGQPSQVFHAEHFARGLHGFTCCAVPIRNPFTQEFIGILDFVAQVQDYHPLTMGMALQMGHCIELELYRVQKEEADLFRECSTQLTLDHLQRGIIILDRARRIRRVNLTALDYLGLTTDQIIDKRIEDVTLMSDWRNLDQPYILTGSEGMTVRLEYKPLLHNRRLLGALISVEPEKRSKQVASLSISTSHVTPLGNSEVYQSVLDAARKAAQHDSNILLIGETGTGKEVMARCIHNSSRRSQEPFIAINCGSLPKELLASELFGYEGGAFTGAKREGHPSKFEMANHGTLLLDEVSEMIPEAQIYLLRVIEERMITRLGGTKNVPVDVRIIAASNRDLQGMVDQGLFRMDLFYRLNVIRLDLPPLRERRGDVGLLAEHFLNVLASARGATIRGFAPGVLEALEAYHWPGNVRELRNTIEQAMVVCEGDYISFDDLPPHLRQALAIPERISPDERDRYFNFIKTYHELDGNISQIARALKVSRPTIYAWREKYGLGEDRS